MPRVPGSGNLGSVENLFYGMMLSPLAPPELRIFPIPQLPHL
jgi:hypothetical protein